MDSELEGLKEWISKIERDGIDRHSENVERMAVLERDRDEQRNRDEEISRKVDAILEILSQGRGVLTLLKLVGWITALVSGIALIYGAFFKGGGH
ncbi:MAG: hypothetical protein VST70_01735 [Nitrospirota bacterium]|nr:hypothetical protein [Nitrospirota bacterium]